MSKANRIYQRAERNGITYESNCGSVSEREWDKLMKGATRANKKMVDKIVLSSYKEFEPFVKYYNPYNHLKTETHLIFVHSAIEHFFRIN